MLDNQRAEYGKQIVATVSRQLQIELLQLDNAGIKVAQYLTELPPRHVLMQQIQKSIEAAKARFANIVDKDEDEA